MKIKQDPVSKLWCRSDGAILMPPVEHTRFKSFRWTFGFKTSQGYRRVGYCGKRYFVHQVVCRAFNGLAPEDKPFVDHINRIKGDNRPENLRWVSNKENCNNKDCVDQSVEKYGVRCCEDKKAYDRARWASKYAKMKAQGLHFVKGPDGKYGWYPRTRT